MSNECDRLTTLHFQVIGTHPSEDQQHLYGSFPDFRGYSDADLNSERFDAVVLLALRESAQGDVLVFAPKAHERWAIQHFNGLADRIFSRFRTIGGEPEKRVQLARAYKTMFDRVHLTGRIMQIQEPPARWVSFGFAKSTPLPGWMPDRLLEVP